jgi:hypothetical protein
MNHRSHKPKYVGNFDIGYENVELYIALYTGGDFITNPTATIWIGVLGDWPFTYQTMLHEVFEYVLFRIGCRYQPDNDLAEDCGNFLFSMNHAQFSNACGRAMQFMVSATPFVKKEWDLAHKGEKSGK